MAIHEEKEREGAAGIAKQFEMSAASMLFDNLQKNQYQYPERSTIRELVSNGVDATNEKLTALQIINGKAKIEDFYLSRDEPMFADSNYMPEYYDAKWLSPIRNEVEIIYEEALPGVNRDTLRIIDTGVGIGHIINPKTRQSRLQGVLKLGYSTKRNSSIPLGKFGIGAKAALSTGIDSYTMITRHNGKEFRFEVYDYKADPIIPRFNMVTKEENPHELFEDWEKVSQPGEPEEWKLRGTHIVYYQTTEQMNGTEIIVKTKRHHRDTYKNAVKSQLLYFKNIKFTVINEHQELEDIPIQADIQYEDEFIILSHNDQFSKPHFVLNGVNYGYVNFQELELEEKLGNIAYKIKPESVSINPSRESLIWDDKTRATALWMQDKVAEIASNMVTKEMDENDLIKWLRKCTQALGDSRDATSIIGKLANMVDRTALKPIFRPMPDFRYSREPKEFFFGMEMIEVGKTQVKKKDTGGYVDKIKRDVVKSWSAINKPIYLQTEPTSNKKEAYMLQIHPAGFIKLKVRDVFKSYQEATELTPEEVKEYEKLKNNSEYLKAWETKRNLFYKFIKESAEIIDYESIIVPKDAKDPDNDEDESAEVEIKGMTQAQLRAIQGKTVCMHPRYYPYYDGNSRVFTWEKKEPVIKDLMLDKATIVYGFQEDEELIHMVANLLTEASTSNNNEFYNSKFKLVRIAMTAAKHYRNHIYIKDFLLSVNPETRTIAMHTRLVNWHTGRKINEVIDRMAFLENFGIFNAEIQRIYNNLKAYKEQNYRHVKGSSTFGCDEEMLSDLNLYANKVIDLQLYIEQHPGNTEAIAAQAKALFSVEGEPEPEETFEGAVGVDINVYKELQKVIEYIEPLEHIFNYVSPLRSAGQSISPELEHELKEIMRNKGIIK